MRVAVPFGFPVFISDNCVLVHMKKLLYLIVGLTCLGATADTGYSANTSATVAGDTIAKKNAVLLLNHSIRGNCNFNITADEFEFKLFDRWGSLVAKTCVPDEVMLNVLLVDEDELKEGVYFYQIKYRNKSAEDYTSQMGSLQYIKKRAED